MEDRPVDLRDVRAEHLGVVEDAVAAAARETNGIRLAVEVEPENKRSVDRGPGAPGETSMKGRRSAAVRTSTSA